MLGTADPNLFQIDILVKAVTPARVEQVAGKESVIFFVPPSFAEDPYKSTFYASGEAKLQLFASAVFTVGALTVDGTTIEYILRRRGRGEGAPLPSALIISAHPSVFAIWTAMPKRV